LEQEIPRFTIIERDGLVIGCAALYPFNEARTGEMARVAIHPDYRDGDRGVMLLNHLKQRAKAKGLETIFVLTTHSLHWFLEQGFLLSDVSALPNTRQELYNYQRRSKVLTLAL
jgi:amino-acid N-acetyltransferase